MSLGRQFWVIAHRWAGLTIALFLAVAGITGTALAFLDDLEPLLAPEVHRAQPAAAGARPLDPLMLREQALARYPGTTINYLPLHLEPGRSLKLSVKRPDSAPRTADPWPAGWDELFIDPYTGRELGAREWGDIGEGAINFMPFLYRLHYSLALGDWGILAFGIAALIWTIDCFIGFYLTFPVRLKQGAQPDRHGAPGWWTRWKPAWLVRWSGGPHKLNFDLHRAGGLWIWPLLLVFAWSGVGFNLPQVYNPVMQSFGYTRIDHGIAKLASPRHAPRIDFRTATVVGRQLALTEMARRGLVIEEGRRSVLIYRPDRGTYIYRFGSNRDFTTNGGRSMVVFDGDTGRLLKTILPQGQSGANTFTNWIMALHMGTVWGLPYRIAVALIGLMVTMLSVTGVLIWTKKRSARIGRTRRCRAPLFAAVPAE